VVLAGTSATSVTPPIDGVEAALAPRAVPADLHVDLQQDGEAHFALLRQDADGVHWDRLPDGRRNHEDGADTWIDLTSDPGVARVVVAREGRVYTLVSEELDADELVDVGLDLPGDRSLLGRFRRACDELLDTFSGG
jgi:hypothetical protein